jgi:hypothetical protein
MTAKFQIAEGWGAFKKRSTIVNVGRIAAIGIRWVRRRQSRDTESREEEQD